MILLIQIAHKKQFVLNLVIVILWKTNVLISFEYMLNNTLKQLLNNFGKPDKLNSFKRCSGSWKQDEAVFTPVFLPTDSLLLTLWKEKSKSIVCYALLCDHTAFSRHQNLGCGFICVHHEYEQDTTYQTHQFFTSYAKTLVFTQV